MFLGFGAKAPQRTITVQRGGSSLSHPITEPAWRAWKKYHPDTSIDTSILRLIPWNAVHRKLLELNPHFFFAPYGDGRVIICLDEVTKAAASQFDRLTHAQKQEADTRHEIKGPRRAIVMAPSSSVSAYTEIICAVPGHLQVPLARSLVTICKACIAYSAFTWEAAELKFGMKLRDVPVVKQFMQLTPTQWSARSDNKIVLAPESRPRSATKIKKVRGKSSLTH